MALAVTLGSVAPAQATPGTTVSTSGTATETVHTTANHPWLTADRGWVEAGNLKPGELVVTLGGSTETVAWVRVVAGQADMYNLTVAQDHTYAVGDSHAVVHNTCGGGEITIYRGTSRPAEIQATSESGYAMSDAARTGYVEARYAGQGVEEALQAGRSASEAADAQQLAFWGSRCDYVQAHSAFGTEFQRELGVSRSMISFTTDLNIARDFAGPNGVIFSATVPASEVFPQTLPGAAEAEMVILHMIPVAILP